MTTNASKADVRQLLTEDIDAQIAELRARKAKLAAAGRALAAAADEVEARKSAVDEAKKTFQEKRQELIALGVKPREVGRLVKELRAADAAANGSDDRAEREGSGALNAVGAASESGPTVADYAAS